MPLKGLADERYLSTVFSNNMWIKDKILWTIDQKIGADEYWIGSETEKDF